MNIEDRSYDAAQYILGYYYYYKIGPNQDYKKAVENLIKAIELGHIPAQYLLGNCYLLGKGVEQDYTKAIECYSKAAEQGYIEAQYQLGWCYSNGIGVEINSDIAEKWYVKANEQWHTKHNKIVENENTSSMSNEVKDLYIAARNGNTDAQYKLGGCYFNGIGVEKNREKAIEWWTKASEQDDDVSRYAEYQLGKCYYEGIGMERDYSKATEWYEKAAEHGHSEAQYILGEFYFNGTIVKKDEKKAVEWYMKSAEQKYAEAQYRLGWCYYNGTGIEINTSYAVKKWLEFIDNTYSTFFVDEPEDLKKMILTAQYMLGYCYYFGNGVNRNRKKAIYWLKEAADRDYREAIIMLKKISIKYKFIYKGKE